MWRKVGERQLLDITKPLSLLGSGRPLGTGTCSSWRGLGPATSFLSPQVVSAQPFQGEGRGAAALRLLNILQVSIHKTLEPLWNTMIPALVEEVEGKELVGS